MKIPVEINSAQTISKEHSIHLEVDSLISCYAITYYQNGFILFGGWTATGDTSTIARLDLATSSWTKLGDLKTARNGHGVIYDGDVFLIIGGYGDLDTEKCTLSGTDSNCKFPIHFYCQTHEKSDSDSTINCIQQEPTLKDYRFYPALFLVADDFC